MAKATWSKFPHSDKAYAYDGANLKKHWDRLHKGDREPFPKEEDAQQAWRLYHEGEFEKAVEVGLKAGSSGLNAANKAAVIYANYLEKAEPKKLKIFEEVAARCEEEIKAHPKNANAHYLYAYALGRYSQGISVTKALAQGLGGKIKASLTKAIELDAKHADAHIALGAYHAEIIDKVGAMVGGLTYGAKKESAVEHFEKALKLNGDSAIARIEYANALAMLFGKAKLAQAESLYQEAAACKPADAMERLDVELAKENLED
jgi:tetratricopeptide (TPR) repeat protein